MKFNELSNKIPVPCVPGALMLDVCRVPLKRIVQNLPFGLLGKGF